MPGAKKEEFSKKKERATSDDNTGALPTENPTCTGVYDNIILAVKEREKLNFRQEQLSLTPVDHWQKEAEKEKQNCSEDLILLTTFRQCDAIPDLNSSFRLLYAMRGASAVRMRVKGISVRDI